MRRIGLTALLCIMVCGCSTPSEPDAWWYTGVIVERDVSIPIGEPPTIHVKEAVTDQCGIVFLVRPSTWIRFQGSGLLNRRSYSDLQVGTKVRVRTGLVLESCPGQASAEMVEIQP
jgi:hypothetical protein